MFNLIAAPIFAVNLFLNINVEYAISSTPVSQMDPETSTISGLSRFDWSKFAIKLEKETG